MNSELLQSLANDVRIPSRTSKIFKDECLFTMHTCEQEKGVFICLKHFVSVGPKVLMQYHKTAGSRAFLNYRVEKRFKDDLPEQPEQPTTLGLGVEGGFALPQNQYNVVEHWALVELPGMNKLTLPDCMPSNGGDSTSTASSLINLGLPSRLAECVSCVQSVESAVLAEEKSREMEFWQADNMRAVSKHAANLVQLDNGVKIGPSGWKCAECDLTENLWLNLTDGSIHCGRRFWDGTGGNNHAVEYYAQTKFPLAVKLGTITPEGGEVYSYAEDDMVTDPQLARHLAHFGINVMQMAKTDKTLVELEIDANQRLGEWRMLQESDAELEARYGPGLTGLVNLGNTCYMNVIVQVLHAIKPFRAQFANALEAWIAHGMAQLTSTNDLSTLVADQLPLQFARLGNGLLSGCFSWKVDPVKPVANARVPLWPGIRPYLLRRLVGLMNSNFASKQQQDAFELMVYLLEGLQKSPRIEGIEHGDDAATSLRLGVERKMVCGLTGAVSYKANNEWGLSVLAPIEAATNKDQVEAYKRTKEEGAVAVSKDDDIVRPKIPFSACLANWAAVERIDDFVTPASDPPGQKTHLLQSARLLNCPNYLCIHANKYVPGPNWTIEKQDVELEFDMQSGDPIIDLTTLRTNKPGMQPGERAIPTDGGSGTGRKSAPNVLPDPVILNNLLDFGFSPNACHRACLATNNAGLEAAATWITDRLGDDQAMLDAPIEEDSGSSAGGCEVAQPPSDLVDSLTNLGILKHHVLQSHIPSSRLDLFHPQNIRFHLTPPTYQAILALQRHANNLEQAAMWALSLPVDQLDSLLIQSQSSGSSSASAAAASSGEQVVDEKLTDNPNESRYRLIAFVSHMGKSTSSGHYVTHIKRSALAADSPANKLSDSHDTDNEWIIFNDDRVAKSAAPPFRFGYLYFFRRLDL